MKNAGYWACRDAVEKYRLEDPRVYEPFTAYFDAIGLMDVKCKFGKDLYDEVMADICEEEGWMDE